MLFSLCVDKNISLEEMRMSLNNELSLNTCLWFRRLRGWECVSELELISVCESFVPRHGPDQVIWVPNNGAYSVKDAYNMLVPCENASKFWSKIWGLRIPIKVKMLLWKVAHDIVPTKKLLLSQLKKGDGICEGCESCLESTSHLFWECSMVKSVWSSIFDWWNINFDPHDQV